MAASFIVSLTVIPVLCSLLLKPAATGHSDGFVVRGMKFIVRHTFLRFALGTPMLVIALAGMLLIASLMLYPMMGKEFLPTFNEGSATISLVNAPGTSLAQSNEIGEVGVRLLQSIPEVKSVGRRAGRAEKDDHVMPVSVNEYDVEFREGGRPKAEVFAEIRQKLGTVPGTFTNVGQPIGHRLSHMLSGVSAKIAVKIFGPELDVLREKGAQVRDIAKAIPGLTDVNLEAQVPIPQIKIEVDRERALAYGIQPGAINEQVSTLLGGTVLTELREGQRTVDLVLRLGPEWRGDVGEPRRRRGRRSVGVGAARRAERAVWRKRLAAGQRDAGGERLERAGRETEAGRTLCGRAEAGLVEARGAAERCGVGEDRSGDRGHRKRRPHRKDR